MEKGLTRPVIPYDYIHALQTVLHLNKKQMNKMYKYSKNTFKKNKRRPLKTLFQWSVVCKPCTNKLHGRAGWVDPFSIIFHTPGFKWYRCES